MGARRKSKFVLRGESRIPNPVFLQGERAGIQKARDAGVDFLKAFANLQRHDDLLLKLCEAAQQDQPFYVHLGEAEPDWQTVLDLVQCAFAFEATIVLAP